MSEWVDQQDRDWAGAFLRKCEAMSADERRVLAIKMRTDAEGMPAGLHRRCVEGIALVLNRMSDAEDRGDTSWKRFGAGA